jgi:hypothetical protein
MSAIPLQAPAGGSAPLISKPGIYDLSNEAYHGQPCVGPSISGSGLTMMEQFCPARFWEVSSLNPNATPEKQADGFSVGKAAHNLILEGEEAFLRDVIVKPEGHNGSTKKGKAWLAEQAERIKARATLINHDEWMMIKAMADAVARDPRASKAFTDGRPEQSLIWQDRQTGIWLKSRPDWLPYNSRFCPNYKTAACAKPSVFKNSAFKNGYDQSAALCIEGLSEVCGIADPVYYFVVQEKERPYLVSIVTLEEADLDWARLLNRRWLDVAAECLQTGVWPGYGDEVVTIRRPVYMERELDRRHEAGEFVNTVLGA